MDFIIESTVSFVTGIIKFIAHTVLWSIVIFYIGYIISKLFSLGQYPTQKQALIHTNVISLVGVSAIFVAWSGIATYNFKENIYLLLIAAGIAVIHFFIVLIKYYPKDSGHVRW